MTVQMRKGLNTSGAALIMVLAVVMVIAIFSITLFSQSMSQTKTTHSQVDQIVAEQLAKGVFWNAYNNTTAGGALNLAASPVTLNGRLFTPTVTPSGTSTVTVKIDY